jgi:hypothetical protein
MYKSYITQSKIKINKYINRYIQDVNLVVKGRNMLKNELIISNEDYSIVREISSRAYIITFSKLIIMTISKRFQTLYEDFELLYNKSSDYIFNIYETEKYYHIICISKYKTPETYLSWLESNDADTKFMAIAELYDSKGFLIINRSWNVCKFKSIYQFKKTVGQANVDVKIRSLVDYIIKLINFQMTFLPIHYLSFN